MPRCASRSHTSPDGAKFCLECGSPFARACPTWRYAGASDDDGVVRGSRWRWRRCRSSGILDQRAGDRLEGREPGAAAMIAVSAHSTFGGSEIVENLELGHWLCRRGRPEEAAPLLGEARHAFVRLGAEPSLAEVDAVAASVVA